MSQSSASLLQSLETDQENWQLRRMAAEALADEGSAPEAAALVVDTPVVPPTEEDLLFAIDLVASVDLDQAGAFASQVVEADGENPEAHVGKAFACWLGGDMETAQAWYQQAQAMQPGFRSGTFEKLLAESAEGTQSPAAETRDGSVMVAPMQDPGTTPNQDLASAPFSVAPPSIAMAQAVAAPVAPPAVPAPSAAVPPPAPTMAPIVPPPSAPVPAPSHFAPQAPMSEEELAALEAAEENAHLADLISHAARNKDSKEKTTAMTVAVVIHLVILALLTLVIVAPALLPAPEIVAVTAPVSSETELQTRQVAPVVQKTPAAPSAPATQIINAAGPSSVSVSSIDFAPELETIDLGSSFGSGFGMGGAGAGMGGGGVPFSMKSRCSRPERIALLQQHGGTVEVESAVEKSLEWLQSQQASDGSWGDNQHRAAMTGFALLCYLGRCETPDSPKYGDTVMNGIMYLVELGSKNNGYFTTNPGDKHFPYEHGIATYALGETYAMARMGNRRLPGVREAFERGVELILEGQNDRGAWDYNYSKGGRSDTSATGWQYQALRAAATTQLEFSKLDRAMRNTREYLESVQGPEGGFGYTGVGDKPTLAGLGTLGLQMLGRLNSATTRKGIAFIEKQPPMTWQNIEIYAAYYNTQALFNAGGSSWENWNKQMLPVLLENQKEDGSWDPMGGGGAAAARGSRVYMTTMSTLMLEIYYRYLPAGSDKESFSVFD